ncbi:Asp23/Gls24 family envelope stress response protein [Streptomyces sp. NPDC046465]|uniref:Asp23/Gls24 family envelope stress response protein n=1 Tax=Streptomyces sp. NPDC046465 TaxID=3155810 RepID=UPI0033C09BE3
MTERLTPGARADAVREAVLGTPGVAFLRPGLAELLRASNLLTRGPARTAGVRLTRDGGSGRWHADIHVVLHRGHRAVDVTREVRAAVAEALGGTAGDASLPRVTVTVTGRV